MISYEITIGVAGIVDVVGMSFNESAEDLLLADSAYCSSVSSVSEHVVQENLSIPSAGDGLPSYEEAIAAGADPSLAGELTEYSS